MCTPWSRVLSWRMSYCCGYCACIPSGHPQCSRPVTACLFVVSDVCNQPQLSLNRSVLPVSGLCSVFSSAARLHLSLLSAVLAKGSFIENSSVQGAPSLVLTLAAPGVMCSLGWTVDCSEAKKKKAGFCRSQGWVCLIKTSEKRGLWLRAFSGG